MQYHKGIPSLLMVLLALILAPVAWTAESEPNIDAEPRVNINQAGPDELAEALDGVGDSKAQAIIEYREKKGPFKSAKEIRAVNGVGEVTFSDNRERIRLE